MSKADLGGCIRGAFGSESGSAAPAVVHCLSLAAAPTFAIVGLVSASADVGPDLLCTAMHHASPLNGMAVMYLLMSVFHLAPWLRLICWSPRRRPQDLIAAEHDAEIRLPTWFA